tara:strand:- start:432 stop:602 length:171 start_codon:yes stop_codon:yes gene_type:complete
MIKSPCIKICQIDYKLGLCLGCKRSLDEISQWTNFTDIEKNKILKELNQRNFLNKK